MLKVLGHCLITGTGGSMHFVKSGFGLGFGVIRFARMVFDEMLQRDIYFLGVQ